MSKLLISALALGLVWASAVPAVAVCGDGILDAGEMCDDGNVGDGDCCTSSCQMPGGCFATLGRSGIFIKDKGDDRQDKVFWKLYRAPSSFEEWGDPTAETPYAFCMWDDDELKFQGRIEPGGICHPRRPCWKTLGRVEPQAYRFFDKPTNATGPGSFMFTPMPRREMKPLTGGFFVESCRRCMPSALVGLSKNR